jgi:hypothetical protein
MYTSNFRGLRLGEKVPGRLAVSIINTRIP